MQYPTEVPGVSLVDALSEALQHAVVILRGFLT